MEKMKKANIIKIGKKIKSIRKSNGYTQERLAEKLECATRYIGDIEQDKSRPSYEILVRICNTFNISMDEIFSDYLDLKDKAQSNLALNGFEKLKPNNQETIIHLIEYFNKNAK